MDTDPIQRLARLRVVPIVTLRDARYAGPLAEALHAGGLPCAEVTFRTAAAAPAIRALVSHGDLLVGAGTVLTVDQVRQAVDAGATFVVTPGIVPAVIDHCLERGIPIVPGVATPTDIAQAAVRGLRVVKFFPAEAFGGCATLRALGAAFPAVRFIPTGGIGPHNLGDYLRVPQVIACGGSWLTAPQLYENGDFAAVTRAAQEAIELIRRAAQPAARRAAGGESAPGSGTGSARPRSRARHPRGRHEG